MSTMEDRLSGVEALLATMAAHGAAMREIDRAMRETDHAMRETDRQMQETNRQMQEMHRQLVDLYRRMHEENLRAQEENRAIREDRIAYRREAQGEIRAIQLGWARSQRKWGELANKMGTLVEDIVAPGIPTVFRRVFRVRRLDFFAQRVRRTHRTDPGRQREFDYVCGAGDVLLVNETKSTIRPDDISAFVALLDEAREYLPEAEGRRLVGGLAGFSVDPSLVAAGERQGLLMFGLGTGLLRILNTPGFQPRAF